MEKNNRKGLYDEDEARAISEQIMDAYYSSIVARDEPCYHPEREVGE
ncbi:hypothetical protein [Parageobacillus thermoglucosidasius]|uniref:Uncharacterized protein n=1 Tax=Parageobacillus thermoglucosidasius TaxID=1426 RepID=A0AB38QVP1_PARTM|nr:hypothetical protein [Parageobacillus thermoglucosidasius]KYD14065.1 hypothetical protein B4168_0887 [Anoxybacillus flavithermus]AEH46882.1 hypothetical protein Geoth_0884 [Parageobacillus thermoglucosidasius C56-YS93]MED4903742.1 hypothetical protein [Parageobacillus thermoglucosidasius]MED4912588.1 hypothetical protein [Parageobacillus thermoglucosidasius]MED4944380.1 hypothetical protein [Parageobacillus thermoglucosidasius]